MGPTVKLGLINLGSVRCNKKSSTRGRESGTNDWEHKLPLVRFYVGEGNAVTPRNAISGIESSKLLEKPSLNNLPTNMDGFAQNPFPKGR